MAGRLLPLALHLRAPRWANDPHRHRHALHLCASSWANGPHRHLHALHLCAASWTNCPHLDLHAIHLRAPSCASSCPHRHLHAHLALPMNRWWCLICFASHFGDAWSHLGDSWCFSWRPSPTDLAAMNRCQSLIGLGLVAKVASENGWPELHRHRLHISPIEGATVAEAAAPAEALSAAAPAEEELHRGAGCTSHRLRGRRSPATSQFRSEMSAARETLTEYTHTHTACSWNHRQKQICVITLSVCKHASTQECILVQVRA